MSSPDVSMMPAINASLNAASAFLLVIGYTLIRQRAITAHTIAMIGATITSLLFLVCYLYYHFHHGSTKFQGQGPVRIVYFAILVSHTILAVVNLPLILRTLWFALKGDFVRHRATARWAFPVWLYVSVTGVVVYWMLYRMDWS